MALSLLAANNAQTVLAAGISSTATSLTVNAGTGTLFPSPVAGNSFFKLTIIDAATGSLTEIVHVTARTGDVFTIQRGQEGTVPRAWSANDIAANMMTAGTLSYILGNFQPLDPTLTALAALVGVANKLPYFSGPDVMSMTDFSDIGRAIIAASDKPSVLSYLELTTLGQALVKGGTVSDILRTLGFNNGNGWYRIGEILIQFGHIPFAATSVPVTFPIPFPVVIDQIIVSDAGYASGNTWGATDRTQLGFTAQTNSAGQGGQYFAIGR
ncbi:hypothetical protein PZS70_22745 [Citrobacter freundii]|uniref:gp53-like domain-containing protein n=1 Tax=Citrobacter freundii TaxID=546 RepID=UPI002B269F15|nr:hypothetical protein [Citrobacter freundii]MEA8842207.1 hypothetical protein [Citrobacter freundii]MEA8847895.1 hypothetical protein [Citrobacter freundii]